MPTFAQPLFLLAVPLLLVAGPLFLLWRERRASQRLRRFVEPHLAARLLAGHSRRRLWIKHSLLLIALALLITALARPQWGVRWEKSESRGIDILFALDTSRSMLAEDVAPNRLQRARLAILDLLRSMGGDRVGLIAFAGDAFLQCPLTLDYQAFRQTLDAMDTETIPGQGTNVAAAIDEALAYFESTRNSRILILLTDGEDLEAEGIARARAAAEEGVRILTVGVGSPSGELIPISGPDGQRDYLRDASGNPVQSALDESTLRRIASATGGIYAPLGPTSRGLEEVYRFSLGQTEASQRSENLQRVPIERFQWPLALALALLLAEALLLTRTRRIRNASLSPLLGVGLALFATDSPANASTISKAEKALRNGEPGQALQLYREAMEDDRDRLSPRHHYNRGVAAYRSGDFTTAVNAFSDSLPHAGTDLQVRAFHNLGNSRVALGFSLLPENPERTRNLWQNALRDFQSAIELNPQRAGSQSNRRQLQQTIQDHTYQLTITAEPAEAGTVSGEGTFFHGIATPVGAEPASDQWQFAGWKGPVDDPASPQSSIALTQDTSLVARFTRSSPQNQNQQQQDKEQQQDQQKKKQNQQQNQNQQQRDQQQSEQNQSSEQQEQTEQQDRQQQQSDSGKNEDSTTDQESSPESEEQQQQQQQTEPAPSGNETSEAGSSHDSTQTLSREEARQLLRALGSKERFLPARRRSGERPEEGDQPSGRDW